MFYFLFSPIFFVIFRVLIRLLGRLSSTGEENVPRSGPVIYCPNHLSDSDPPTVFVTIPRRAWFVAKDDLLTVPVVGWVLDHGHVIFIKRDSADRKALRQCEEVLKRGEPLVIFPEGRCAQAGRLLPVQPGAAMLALRTGAPIVPIGVRNTNEMLPYGSLRPRFARRPVRLAFGKPIDPGAYGHLPRSQALEAITRDLTKALSELSGLPEPETPRRARRAPRVASPKTEEALASLDIL
jgi:1-acyl-sn-glycerol-3-phosphate acyltransferase